MVIDAWEHAYYLQYQQPEARVLRRGLEPVELGRRERPAGGRAKARPAGPRIGGLGSRWRLPIVERAAPRRARGCGRPRRASNRAFRATHAAREAGAVRTWQEACSPVLSNAGGRPRELLAGRRFPWTGSRGWRSLASWVALVLAGSSAFAEQAGAPRYTNAEVVKVRTQERLLVIRNNEGVEQTLELDDQVVGIGELRPGDRVILTLRGEPGRARIESFSKAEAPSTRVASQETAASSRRRQRRGDAGRRGLRSARWPRRRSSRFAWTTSGTASGPPATCCCAAAAPTRAQGRG